LFFDLDTSEIVDLVGGVDDLKNGIIRTVGNAEDRFNEDRLRILRAIRFAARFSNGLHSGIIDALGKDSSLKGISAERIRDEFLKCLKSANSTVFFLEMLDSFNLFDWIFPNMVVNKKFIEDKDPIVVLATLLKNHEWGKLRKDLNKLTFSTSEIKAIELLTALHKLDIDTAVVFKNILKNSGVSSDQLRNFGSSEGISSQLLDAFEEFELSVDGDEVMKEFNLKPSKELGDKIRELETNNFKKLLGIS
jgi:tRNA nucleotidyltransferase/poly(A) polymerase